ncbi:hypothetical protein QVD17_00775 [Tagetes erecta]|uniref:LETM1-like protein n=1 Tax=Tagetes erecta TaxID=13708 RepID=A0AAD8L3T2_TARER|nr:hypothetical protein QVD17_00775 [Tagetes erecta]
MTISQPHALPSVCCHRSIALTKYLNPWNSCKHSKTCFFHKKVYSRKRFQINLCLLDYESLALSSIPVDLQFSCLTVNKLRRTGHFLPFACADDGVTVNDGSQVSTSGNVEGMQNEEYNSELIQLLHDAARECEVAIKEQISTSMLSWFPTAWLGIDQHAWVKAISYQASVYSLLLAACERSSRGDRRDRDVNVFVQRSLSWLSSPLESKIRDALSDDQNKLCEWFWSEQVPLVVSSFVNYFEKDKRFAAATGVLRKGASLSSGDACDRSLLMLALSCIAAITKLGPTKVACTQLISVLPELTGRLMDMLVKLVPIRQAYSSINEIGLHKDFLVHFGPRATACIVKDDQGTEVLFWVSLVQKQLQWAIDRERIWLRLTTCESIEVLNKDLAIFGFFIALGRRTQSFLSANNFEVLPPPIERLIRYLIGGSVLYYPQLSSISSYQLYVEVVCEELDWLPFYPGEIDSQKGLQGHKSKKGPPNEEAVPIVLDVCSHWIQSFIKYNKWLENPSNVKAARFLSRGRTILQESVEELAIPEQLMIDSSTTKVFELTRSRGYAPLKKELDSFDKEDINMDDYPANRSKDAEGVQLVKVQEKEDIIGQSISKFRRATMDVLQGTQLLAIDAAAAIGLLRRALIGNELTNKEKHALRRTLTDLASVIPIGILMLLPVTAVGHAAMLAAIQRYVPSLIPSTYGPERLDLLRQLEKIKELETIEPKPIELAAD